MDDWLLTISWLLGAVAGQADADPACLVLGGLDSVRTEAITSARPERLLDVYADDALLVRDADAAEAYLARDLQVQGAAMERISCAVAERTDTSITLDVVDRLGPTWVVTPDGERRVLPRDQPTRRTLVLGRTPYGWRLAGSR